VKLYSKYWLLYIVPLDGPVSSETFFSQAGEIQRFTRLYPFNEDAVMPLEIGSNVLSQGPYCPVPEFVYTVGYSSQNPQFGLFHGFRFCTLGSCCYFFLLIFIATRTETFVA